MQVNGFEELDCKAEDSEWVREVKTPKEVEEVEELPKRTR